MDDLDIAKIMTSQNDLRNVWQICDMVAYVRSGGVFTREALDGHAAARIGRGKPMMITITEFPDGVYMTHDGHHRLTSIWLGGRSSLLAGEYRIKKFTYEEYSEMNLAVGWMTPFDPIAEIRLCEFGHFKDVTTRLLSEDVAKAAEYVKTNRHLYSAKRDIVYIPELAERISIRLGSDSSAQHGSGFCLATRW